MGKAEDPLYAAAREHLAKASTTLAALVDATEVDVTALEDAVTDAEAALQECETNKPKVKPPDHVMEEEALKSLCTKAQELCGESSEEVAVQL